MSVLAAPGRPEGRQGQLTRPEQLSLDSLARHIDTSMHEVFPPPERADIGYLGRILVQATMPHSRPAASEIERRNGDLYLSMMAPRRLGLPYGTPPRHILAWVTTEAVRTKSRVLLLGNCYGEWLRALGVEPGGQQYRRYQQGAASLFGTTITCTLINDRGVALTGTRIADNAELWWDPKAPDQLGLWSSTVELTERFYASLVDRPVPIDLETIRRLGRSPLALDLYAWLTYRMSYLRSAAVVPWEALHDQFGAEYTRRRDFKRKATLALQKVSQAYPAARVSAEPEGLRLLPSPPHVSRRLLPKP